MLDGKGNPTPAQIRPEGQDHAPSRAFLDQLIGELPRLRGAAVMMARVRADADDLLQTTAARALAAHGQFSLGTNMRAWLYRIMRNEFIDMVRMRDRNAARLDDVPDDYLKQAGTQEDALEMRDVLRAINTLTHIHREALFLLCVDGLSYEEIAEIQGCAVGTVKSRISRARQDMKTILNQGPSGGDDGIERPMSNAAARLLAAAATA
jgi:RNA polymerase sigma-70 factor (ECF subfamily)